MNPWRPNRPSGPKAKMFEVTWYYFKLKMSKMTPPKINPSNALFHLEHALTKKWISEIWARIHDLYTKTYHVYQSPLSNMPIFSISQSCARLYNRLLQYQRSSKIWGPSKVLRRSCNAKYTSASNANTKCIPVCSSLFFMDIQYFARHWTEQQKDSIKYWPIQIKWLGSQKRYHHNPSSRNSKKCNWIHYSVDQTRHAVSADWDLTEVYLSYLMHKV
jgi:hypothetical protein